MLSQGLFGPDDARLMTAGLDRRGHVRLDLVFAVFLTRVVADKELPFALKAPNATSRVAIAEANEIIKSRRARFATADALLNDLEEASRK